MDSDFSHDPNDLARLLAAAEDADLVLGSRYVAGGAVVDWGPVRRFVSRGGSWYSRIVLGLRVRDLTGGFKCFRREVLEAIDLPTIRARGYAFQVELTNRAVHAGLPRRRAADRLPRPPARHVEDDAADRRRGGAARAAAALRSPSHIRPARRAAERRGRAARADARRVHASDLVLVRGIAHTRETLDAWNDRPGPVLGRWLAGSLAIADAAARGRLGRRGQLDPGRRRRSCCRACTATRASSRSATSCSATGSCSRCTRWRASRASSPAARCRSKPSATAASWRWIHDKAGPLAIAFVTAATVFSLLTQSYALGMATSTLADQGGISPGLLLVGLLPHALPELVALFLPLAAWIIASRRGQWHQLLAATFVTVMLAVPVLVASAFVEVYFTPGVLRALAG